MCIESNSLLAVRAINDDIDSRLEVGHVIDSCMSKLVSRNDICVRYVRRLTNRSVHSLDRISYQLNCYVNFMIPQHSMLNSVMHDMSF